jgi:glycosyltransferase involved in cell wall biosynthesis
VAERALFVIGSLDRGGAEGQLLELARGLVERGWGVSILCLTHVGAQADEARDAGIEVVIGRFQGAHSRDPRPFLRALTHARRVIASRDPDVVHAHLEWANLIGIPAARMTRVPVVVGSRLQLGDIVHSRHFRPLVKVLQWGTTLFADAVVCNSRAVLSDSFGDGRTRPKAHLIYNGVAVEPLVAPPDDDEIRIVAIANLHPYKGHDVLIKAFARAIGGLPPAVRVPVLELAGTGIEEQALGALVRELSIESRVRFLGSVSDVPGLLDRSSFSVLSSRTEGLPNAVLESLSRGRAVVASAVGGIPEILDTGGGLLVPPGDVDALAGALLRLVKDRSLRERLGRQGRRSVEQRFALGRLVDQHEELYRRLLRAKRTSGLRGRARGRV